MHVDEFRSGFSAALRTLNRLADSDLRLIGDTDRAALIAQLAWLQSSIDRLRSSVVLASRRPSNWDAAQSAMIERLLRDPAYYEALAAQTRHAEASQ